MDELQFGYGDYGEDEFDYDDEYDDEYDWEDYCVECGEPSSDECCCCGASLCYMHWEMQAGFCSNCPTPEWIAEREAELQQSNDKWTVELITH